MATQGEVLYPVGTKVRHKASGREGVVERVLLKRMPRYRVDGFDYKGFELEPVNEDRGS